MRVLLLEQGNPENLLDTGGDGYSLDVTGLPYPRAILAWQASEALLTSGAAKAIHFRHESLTIGVRFGVGQLLGRITRWTFPMQPLGCT